MFGMMSQIVSASSISSSVGRAVAEALLGLPDDGLAHLGVVVAHDHRAPGQHVVDVALAVHVVEVGAVGAVDEDGRAAHGLEGADR
jgi:hypothetical protein